MATNYNDFAQKITTNEQKEMIKEIIAKLTKDYNNTIVDERDDVAYVYKDLIKLFQDALDTGLYFPNVCSTIEEEYEHQMSLVL